MDSIGNHQSSIINPIIYPVILAVPENDRQMSAREKVGNLSLHARRALEISAQKNGIVLTDLKKDKNGAPLPFNGNYWSLTHKARYVGAVIARVRIGIDLEEIRPCSEALFNKTADHREWDLAGTNSSLIFFRYWTSKECVLKAAGAGIRDLKKCRIVQLVDDHNLVIDYQDRKWQIEHLFFGSHIASVVKDDSDIQWTIINV